MFIQTEATPNPATLKFIPGKVVLPSGTKDFRAGDDTATAPLVTRLMTIPGVAGVFLGYDFITITKSGAEWPHLKPAVLGAIMEHYMSGAPMLVETKATEGETEADGEFFDAADQDTVDTIKELLESRVRPAVAQDGGDITFKGFKDGVVYLHMKGSCAGCPSSTATLRHGIQNLLKHFLPDVQEVRAA